jgi:CheY-like chemotaxis protein
MDAVNRLPPPDATPRRVLVVEDHPDGRASLRLLLQFWGFEVEVAADGRAGLAKALSWRPDCAVVDIGLPLLSGFEVAEGARAALGRGIRLVALTAYGETEDQALRAGFDDFLTKPADPDELARALGRGPGL